MLSVDSLIEKGKRWREKQKGKKDTKKILKKTGSPYIRTITVDGRKYQQLVRHIRDDTGKRKLEIIKHIGRIV